MRSKRMRRKGLYEPFLLNPHHRIGRRTIKKSTMRRKKRRKNSLGEMAMVVGNPRRRGGVTRMARRRRKRNAPNPRRGRRSIFRAARRRRRNPIMRRRRRNRRNPLVGSATTGKLATILTGAVSAILVTAMPDLIKAKTTAMKYGVKVATVLLGSWLVSKMLKSSEKGFVWGLVGSSVIAADLLKTYVLKGVVPGLEGVGGMGQYYYLPAPSGTPGYYIPENEYSVVPSGPFGQ